MALTITPTREVAATAERFADAVVTRFVELFPDTPHAKRNDLWLRQYRIAVRAELHRRATQS